MIVIVVNCGGSLQEKCDCLQKGNVMRLIQYYDRHSKGNFLCCWAKLQVENQNQNAVGYLSPVLIIKRVRRRAEFT